MHKLFAGRPEVFARVEFGRFFIEYFPNRCCKDQAAIGVDVDLAHSRSRCFSELIFRNTDSRFQLSVVVVDEVDVFLKNGTGSVQNDGKTGDSLFDLLKDIEAQRRGEKREQKETEEDADETAVAAPTAAP